MNTIRYQLDKVARIRALRARLAINPVIKFNRKRYPINGSCSSKPQGVSSVPLFTRFPPRRSYSLALPPVPASGFIRRFKRRNPVIYPKPSPIKRFRRRYVS